MPTHTLETLPLIVLERICEYLAQSDPKRRSLQAFSLVSKRCCSAAESQRFGQIRVIVRGRRNFRDDLCQWNEILNADNRFRCVRGLTVSGWGSVLEKEEGENYETIDEEDDEDGDENMQDYFGMHECCGPSNIPNKYVTDRGPSPQHEAQPEAWELIAHFIGKLPGLKDLAWGCGTKIPRNILSAVHTVGCRLHVNRFSLSSLIQDREHPHDIDPDEFALATSPCLYSIVVPFYGYDEYGNINYNQEAVLRMVAGAAPNLAHIWMRLSPPGASIALRAAYHSTRPTWPGFFRETKLGDEPKRGSLQSLVISDSGLSPEQIENWSHITDFSKLRHLVIHWNDNSHDVVTSLHVLASLASHGHFESLHALMLTIPVGSSRQVQEALSLLLERLNPLEKLYLSGFISNTAFKTALCHHGSTMRTLRVIPRRHSGSRKPPLVFSAAEAKHLVEQCPNLERLEFPVNRTQGDAEETAIYRELSKMQRLKHLTLVLHITLTTDEEYNEDEEDEEDEIFVSSSGSDMPFADIRRCFINTAIDSSLALSIFNLISLNGRLKYLRLRVSQNLGPAAGDNDLHDILTWLGRSWACKYNDRGTVSIRECDKDVRIWLDDELQYLEEDLYLKVWNSIWPQRTSRWWENWKSFPLSDG
ncbi:hypothetical protein F4801DRAFT_533351 [Xylaria longipes]|nr:hypothetical protein F4801DRAFT_533351 [Xylaria longipes]